MLKEGQLVKVVNEKAGHEFDIGQTIRVKEIKEVNTERNVVLSFVGVDESGTTWWLGENEVKRTLRLKLRSWAGSVVDKLKKSTRCGYKTCTNCGKPFSDDDFSIDGIDSNVCPDCFTSSCREIDEEVEKMQKKGD